MFNIRIKYTTMFWKFVTFSLLFDLNTIFAERPSIYMNEIQSLSELPMDKLINIKNSFMGDDDSFDDQPMYLSHRTFLPNSPFTLPLKKSNKKPIRRYEDHHEKEKDTKISKIFQLAITALSFLAFGGYLLCLVISSVKNNSNLQNSGIPGNNVIVLSNLQKLNRPKRNFIVQDPEDSNFNIDKLYRGMIMLSQTYASYN